jgi:hypothetical protein
VCVCVCLAVCLSACHSVASLSPRIFPLCSSSSRFLFRPRFHPAVTCQCGYQFCYLCGENIIQVPGSDHDYPLHYKTGACAGLQDSSRTSLGAPRQVLRVVITPVKYTVIAVAAVVAGGVVAVGVVPVAAIGLPIFAGYRLRKRRKRRKRLERLERRKMRQQQRNLPTKGPKRRGHRGNVAASQTFNKQEEPESALFEKKLASLSSSSSSSSSSASSSSSNTPSDELSSDDYCSV